MAANSGKLFPVGTRYVTFYALNASGRPAATSPTTPYAGIQAEAAKNLQLTVPEPRRITHAGDDRVQAVDSLPPLEGSSAELHIAKTNYTLQALLSGVLVRTIGESKGMLYATDQQGFEPIVGMLAYQQALEASGSAGLNGSRVWRDLWFPGVKAIQMPHGTDDNAADLIYRITPYIGNAYLWGEAFTLVSDGATQAQFGERMTDGKPWLDSWLGNNSATVFTLSKTAVSTAKITVFVGGVLRTANLTITTTSVTFTSGTPGSNVDVNILYEW